MSRAWGAGSAFSRLSSAEVLKGGGFRKVKKCCDCPTLIHARGHKLRCAECADIMTQARLVEHRLRAAAKRAARRLGASPI